MTTVLANSLRALVNAQQKIRTAKLMATFEIVLNLIWLLAAFLLLPAPRLGMRFRARLSRSLASLRERSVFSLFVSHL